MSYSQMSSALFSPLQLHFSTIIIAVFVIFLSFPTSIGIKDWYKECSSLKSCGNISNIGYPFWGYQFRPRHCGHPSFELVCPQNDSDGHPTLHINGYDDPSYSYSPFYQVLGINNSSMTIMLQDFCDDPAQCLIPFSNLSAVAKELIEYSTRVEKIGLSYGCDPDGVGALATLKSFTSPHGDGNSEQATYYYGENDKTRGNLKRLCKESIEVPIISKDNLTRGNITLDGALEKGFEVNYTKMYLRDCLPCEKSGGHCGCLENWEFICFNESWDFDSDSRKSGNHKLVLKIAIPAGACLFILTALIVGLFYLKKRKFQSQTSFSRITSYNHMRSDLESGSSFFGIRVFSYMELQEATNNFDPGCILGEGGFGIVYHGKLRDGREVAVKRLYERNYKRVGQSINEVEILIKLKHPNLVTLYGCTSRHSRELLLVYEYIPNGTVADHLHGDRSDSTSLNWTARMKIAIQTADALSYLHASEFVHRDVKTNNILLDNNFSVKVADFGLSRLFPLDATHVSTAPQGTPGYLDPEYRKYYQVTNKSDVYSFGVVLIELISSLPPIDISRDEGEINLSSYAMNKIQQGALEELVDQKLGFKSDFKVKRMVTLVAELAFQCLQQEKEIRPSMEEVLEALKRIESMDYEAMEAEEMSRGPQTSQPASRRAGSEVEQPLRNAQNPNSLPKSEIGSWTSRSTISGTSG